jgi:hypothetical protein
MVSFQSAASVREHLVEELNDLLHAEHQLIEQRKASREELKAAFRSQLAYNAEPATETEGSGPAAKQGPPRTSDR